MTSIAAQLAAQSYDYRDQDFQRNAFMSLVDWYSYWTIYDSNDGQRDVSFSSTQHYRFSDGSVLEVGCSGAWVVD